MGVPVNRVPGLERDVAQVTEDGGLGHRLDVRGGLLAAVNTIEEVLPVSAISPLRVRWPFPVRRPGIKVIAAAVHDERAIVADEFSPMLLAAIQAARVVEPVLPGEHPRGKSVVDCERVWGVAIIFGSQLSAACSHTNRIGFLHCEQHDVDHMHTPIAQKAAPGFIEPAPMLVATIRLIWRLGRRTEPEVPVQSWGWCLGRLPPNVR